jgi:NADH:ubiquinone oxidoreductase subunit 6 (subunit J)
MSLAFLIIALVTVGSAAVAMTLRNLIHSALLLVLSWAGVAAFYLWAGAEFVAFGQVLVYVGAVSMIVLFAVLLTRHTRLEPAFTLKSLPRVLGALLAGGATLGVLFGAVLGARLPTAASPRPVVTVKELGLELMGPHAAALLIVGVILTVALIGAVVIAASDAGGQPAAPARPDKQPSAVREPENVR